MTCWYRFRSFRGTPRDWILRIRFKKFKVGVLLNATHCHMGYMQIVDGNAKTDVSNRKEPGMFCGETEQPQTFISETSFVKVQFHTDNFTDQTYFSFDSRAEQQFEVYLRYGQHPELYPNRRGEVVSGSYCERVFRDCRLQTCYVQSPAYPGVYPRGLHCRYHLNTRLPFIKLYIENEEFNIDGQRCENIMTCPMRPISSGEQHCPYDYIKIYDGKDEGSPVIGTFCGMGKFPYSIIGTSEDLFVEFVSSLAGPLLNTGFHFNVGNWPGHVETAGSRNGTCDWVLSSSDLASSGDSEGIFLSVAHWYPPHTSCTYLMQGSKDEVVRLYFPSFRINRIESPIQLFDGDCGESLTLYDAAWPDDSRIIKTFCDTFSRAMEKHDFVSTGNALFVRFESKTGSYSGSSLYYWAHYDFFNNTRYGEPVAGSACDEVFPSWRAASGYLRSPLNTLVYKRQDTQDVRCLYRFVTDKRLFARVILTVTAFNFKEHPYNAAPCADCWEDRADKLLVWEPPAANSSAPEPGAGACLCRGAAAAPPVTVVSRGERLHLLLAVDAAHAAASYFKHAAPLFEARYEFVHGPLCGPPELAPAPEGELVFPHLEALGWGEPPRAVRCIWQLRVSRDRDLWLHFDQVQFASRACEHGRLEVFLAARADPFLSVCGENVSALRDVPVLSAADLQPAVELRFSGSVAPARAAFKVAWTELFHLPRHADGSLATAPLADEACGFVCPGDAALCVPARLVCNGVANCPNSSEAADEAPELCARAEPADSWLGVGLGAAGGLVLAAACLALLCRACCRKRPGADLHVPY
ncbi:cubilin [Bacillus rossius redtenbacheri]|uniref:cubilin n=1 Tax=Bacillus rossius redtenbacheri TaxID=93214 RepID=UPI002FDE2462